jgi:hypothetical protein
VGGGIGCGQIATHRGPDETAWTASEKILHYLELSGDSQVSEIGLGEIRNFQVDTAIGQSLAKDLSLAGLRTGSKAVQIDKSHTKH